MCRHQPTPARIAVSRPFQAVRKAVGLSRPRTAADLEQHLARSRGVGRAPLGPVSLNGSTSTEVQHPRKPEVSTAYGSFAPQPVDGEDMAEVEAASDTRPPLPLGRPEIVNTQYGPITVLVSGDRRKTALLTCHDVGMDPQRCFQGLLMRRKSPLVERFCHFHVVLPGFEEGAHAVPSKLLPLDAAQLTRMVAAVVVHYGIKGALGMGVGYGGHVLTSLALQTPGTLAALVLVSPSCGSASWSDRLWHTALQPVAHRLSAWLRTGGSVVSARDAAWLVERRACCRDTPPSDEVLSAYRDLTQRRRNLLPESHALKAQMLLFVGTASPFAKEGLELSATTCANSSYLELECGTVVTEEHPEQMVGPLDLFLQRLAQSGIGL